MKVFEYLVVVLLGYLPDEIQQLNDLGKWGWELVAIDKNWGYLKREKHNAQPKETGEST